MKKLILVAYLIPAIAVSAPTKKDLDEVSSIVNRSAQNLGGLIQCDRLDARNSYVTTLRDALSIYPGVDLTKMRALIRQIEQQGEAIAKLDTISSPTEDDLERQQRMCVWQIADAQRDMRKLNSFILK